ncbi:hypothetical protein [Aquimarina algiphila]|uniref:hypothetical protein n=1 Tax=Aquimarina algiphila TaxID=2047982 RepID=UPI00248F6522|nr:hypothetical protein [Aquimarina algiphila]
MATTTLVKKDTKKDLAKKAASAAKKGIDKTGDLVKSNPKTALYVVGGVVLGFVVYRLVKTLNAGGNAVDGIFNPDIDNQVDVGDLDTNGATITAKQARVFAQQLLDAFNHKAPFWGTDEKTILEIFNQLSPANFKVVFNAFGKKDYNGYNSPPSGIFANLDSYEPRDLVYWLNSELSPSDGEVYKKVKQIVNAAGFAF